MTKLWWPWLLLLTVVFGIGLWAVELNRTYYSHNGPFYDSVDYQTALAKVVINLDKVGLIETLRQVKQTTVFLPWLVGGMLGYILPLSRELGVWVQWVWLLAFAFSLFFYLHKLRRVGATMALAMVLPFLATAALYRYNGGLSDFRMDLHLYLLFATAAVWFLGTYEDPRIWTWAMFGLFCGLACLGRATAPVYLAVGFGPLLLIRLILAPNRSKLLVGCLTAGGISAVVSLWFFIWNYEFLRFYYVEWNLDANAHLPLRVSVQHAWYVAEQLGWVSFALAAALCGIQIFERQRSGGIRGVDFKPLYIGAAPLLFLIFRGAGPNPFVSMPASFGLLLFLIAPFKDGFPTTKALPLLFAGLGGILLVGWQARAEHISGGMMLNPMAAHRAVIDAVLADYEGRRPPTKVGMISCSALTNSALRNVLIYDYGFRPKEKGGYKWQNYEIHITQVPATKVDWIRQHGPADAAGAAQSILANAKYHILPEDKTISHLEKWASSIYINTQSRELKRHLLASGQLQPVSDVITFSSAEKVRVYRRTRPTQENPAPVP